MQADCPKQYLQLNGFTILQHTLQRLRDSLPSAQITVAVATDDPYWDQYTYPDNVVRVAGGAERCHSVHNALIALQNQADDEDWVIVHDAARPCVRPEDIQHLLDRVMTHTVGGLLALPVRDTMKRANAAGEIITTVSRDNLWHALTPQVFRYRVLLHALTEALNRTELVTDEAQALEKLGYTPLLVAGQADNIKITHPDDLALAERYLQQQALS